MAFTFSWLILANFCLAFQCGVPYLWNKVSGIASLGRGLVSPVGKAKRYHQTFWVAKGIGTPFLTPVVVSLSVGLINNDILLPRKSARDFAILRGRQELVPKRNLARRKLLP